MKAPKEFSVTVHAPEKDEFGKEGLMAQAQSNPCLGVYEQSSGFDLQARVKILLEQAENLDEEITSLYEYRETVRETYRKTIEDLDDQVYGLNKYREQLWTRCTSAAIALAKKQRNSNE